MKTALLIGISDYDHLSKLKNPANDAGLLSPVLYGLGYTIIPVQNADRKHLHESLKFVRPRYARSSIAVFYFAGHGVQKDGVNYLIPRDAKIKDESDIDHYSIRLDEVLDTVSAGGSHISVVILDTCRNNPFAFTRSISHRGLAYVESRSNMIICFSTSPDSAALDGDGDNSPYTGTLCTVLTQTDLTFIQQLCETRQRVVAQTRGKQMPWESISLFSDFYLISGVPERIGDSHQEMATFLRNKIDSIRPTLVTTTIELADSPEGGSVSFCSKDDAVYLIERRQYFETGQFSEEYYLFNRSLFFYTKSTIRYAIPMNMPGFRISDGTFSSLECTIRDGTIYKRTTTGGEHILDMPSEKVIAEMERLLGLFLSANGHVVEA